MRYYKSKKYKARLIAVNFPLHALRSYDQYSLVQQPRLSLSIELCEGERVRANRNCFGGS